MHFYMLLSQKDLSFSLHKSSVKLTGKLCFKCADYKLYKKKFSYMLITVTTIQFDVSKCGVERQEVRKNFGGTIPVQKLYSFNHF